MKTLSLAESCLARGKRTDNGAWETGFLVITRAFTSEAQCFISDKMTGYLTPVDPNTVGRCAGIVDIHKRFIFQDDFVRFRHNGADVVSRVTSDGGETALYVKGSANIARPIESFMGVTFEVVGNVYDNPELKESNTGYTSPIIN